MANAKQQEDWLLSGWERSQYDDGPRESLGVIVNIDRVVVVTGVSSGIGHATARALVAHQCHVFGSVRKEADGKRLQAELGDFFTPLMFDVTDEAGVRAAAAEVKSRMKGHTLLGLVNNAGYNVGMEPTADLSLETLRQQLEVNLVGQVSVTQAFLPLLGMDLSLRGRPGKIINMSSIYASYTLPFQGAYSASKAGLEAMSEGLRRELTPFGIDVIIMKPGPIETGIWGKSIDKPGGAATPRVVSSLYDSYLERALAMSRREITKPGFFLPASRVGEKVWKVLNSGNPAVRYVVTPDWPLNWLLPTWLPRRMVDKEIARRFGLHKPLERGDHRKEE